MTPYTVVVPDIFMTNIILFSILLLILILTTRYNPEKKSLIPISDTQEMKGFAMIAVVAIHIGYTLVNNWEFIYPISAFGGIGVDLFLLLSGYGLTMSMIKKPLNPLQFYKKRLFRVFLPFWVIISIFFLADWLFLHSTYSIQTIIQSYLAYFPRADIWQDFNSPLWFLTWLAFFYILFPLVFIKKYPTISGCILFILGLIVVKVNIFEMQTNWLHGLHLVAFPLGVVLGSLESNKNTMITKFMEFRNTYNTKIISLVFYVILFGIGYYLWEIKSEQITPYLTGIEQYVHTKNFVEQIKSILLTIIALLFFVFKPFKNHFLFLFGVLSYEIYLLHWPLMGRYDIFFHSLSAWQATLIWITLCMILAWIVQKMIKKIPKF